MNRTSREIGREIEVISGSVHPAGVTANVKAPRKLFESENQGSKENQGIKGKEMKETDERWWQCVLRNEAATLLWLKLQDTGIPHFINFARIS